MDYDEAIQLLFDIKDGETILMCEVDDLITYLQKHENALREDYFEG
jgi:hypothetical protein